MPQDLISPTVPPTRDACVEDHGEADSVIMRVRACDVALSVHEPHLRESLRQMLQEAGYATVAGAGPAPVILFESAPGLDLSMALAAFRADAPSGTAILAIIDEADNLTDCCAMGVFACVRKPVVCEELLAVVASALAAESVKLQVADLSRRLDLESHLASIGRIGAGLAHELGSPLAVAISTFEFVRDRVRALGGIDGGERYEILEALEDASASLERMAALRITMQEISRQPRCALGPVRVADVAAEVHRWAAAESAFSGTQFDLLVDHDIVVLAERVRLAQILVNLVSNAAQAAQTLSSPRVRIHVYRASSGGVISVRDNGSGISNEAQEKIFEPFYTTRRSAGGTGLGLSLCREYALQMSAQISLWSLPGRGACFRVSFQSTHQ